MNYKIHFKNWDEIIQLIDLDDVYKIFEDPIININDINIFKNINYLKINISNVSVFKCDDYDIVNLNIYNEILDNVSIPIAYVKKGTNNKYNINYQSIIYIDNISYYDSQKEIIIELNKYNSDSTPILENNVIPSYIKNLGKKITNNILSDLNKTNSYNILGNEIEIKTYNKKISDVRGLSFPNKIEITFDFDKINYNNLSRVVYHELHHTYEIIKRIEKNSKLKLQWDISNILRNISLKYEYDNFISDLSYLLYQSFNHEINARITDVYPFLISFDTTNYNVLLEFLKKTESWKYKDLLKNWKPDWNKVDYNSLIKFLYEFNSLILNKYNNLNFKIYKLPENSDDCKEIIKNWIYIFRKKSKYFEKKLLEMINVVILDINDNKNSYVDKINDKWIVKKYKSYIRELKINNILN